MAVKYRPGVGQHVCWLMSVDMSAEYQSRYGPIVLTDTQSTDALTTHDPKKGTKRFSKVFFQSYI